MEKPLYAITCVITVIKNFLPRSIPQRRRVRHVSSYPLMVQLRNTRQGIPPKYIRQLMAILTKRRWMTSQCGARGGVKLAVSLESITVKEVIELAQGPLLVKECLARAYPCERRERCPLLLVWSQAQRNRDSLPKAAIGSEHSGSAPRFTDRILCGRCRCGSSPFPVRVS
ncbi:MAG TPA: Rrf2 family transcriptional regulator [Firmicutes bacterium]|nr:Rrf2 family transcriptional regulator [Candidatus Fermentithermobacillaceae bacterium]